MECQVLDTAPELGQRHRTACGLAFRLLPLAQTVSPSWFTCLDRVLDTAGLACWSLMAHRPWLDPSFGPLAYLCLVLLIRTEQLLGWDHQALGSGFLWMVPVAKAPGLTVQGGQMGVVGLAHESCQFSHPLAQRVNHVPSPHRCPLKTLQKCEIALEKLKNDMAVVSGVLWSGEVLRAAGNVRAHPTVTRNHRLRAALTVQGGQRGLTTQPGHPAWSFLPGRSAVGGGEVGEIALQLSPMGASSNIQAVGFPLSCLHILPPLAKQ